MIEEPNQTPPQRIPVNEEIFPDIGKRQVAFEYKGDDTELTTFVFKMPNMGQQRKLMGMSDNTMERREKVETIISLLKDRVVVPSAEVFEAFYNALYPEETAEFMERYSYAMESRRKK